MKRLWFALPLATASPLEPPQDALMDLIEATVVLPPGALPRARYGRNYAYTAPDQVMAVYLEPPPPFRSDAGCQETDTDTDFNLRPCSAATIADLRARYRLEVASQAAAGRRRWFPDAQSLPTILDGGCAMVTIEYSVRERRALIAACNGPHDLPGPGQ